MNIADDVKAFDDRLRYSTAELLALREEMGSAASTPKMRYQLPKDLRADLWKDLMEL